MITLNEKMKKFLKVAGIILGLLVLWFLYNVFMGSNSYKLGTSTYETGLSSKSSMSMSGSNASEMSQRAYEMDSVGMAEDNSNSLNNNNSSEPVSVDKKVIKNGSLSLKIEKTEKAAEEISQITKNQGGEVFSTNFYERVKGQKTGSMTVKVPVQKFEETIGKIKEVATQVVSESTAGKDVTEQYADLQIQVKNKKAEEESFVKILDRAGEIDDVLAVTQQISRVRGEIERLEGRIRLMDSQTDMSTITVSLSEDIEIAPVSNDWRPIQVVKKSFSELVDSMQGFVDGLIRFVIVTLPSLIIFLIIVWIFWSIGKKIFKKIFGQKVK
jgi:hypothetical protein